MSVVIKSTDVTDTEIELFLKDKGVGFSKFRKSCRMSLEGTILTNCGVIEVYAKAHRKFFPVSFDKGWKFATHEDRDDVFNRIVAKGGRP